MAMPVVMGDLCQCMYGANPLPIMATAMQVVQGGKPFATIFDMPSGVFGICNSPLNPAAVAAKAVGATVPCTPTFIPPWTPGSPTVMIGGKVALNNSSKLNCAFAPMGISISSPSAATVQVP